MRSVIRRIESTVDLTEFTVFGPFELVVSARKGGRAIDEAASREEILRTISARYPDDNLESKPGCYIFGMRTGGRGAISGSYKPWYVGKAKRQALLKESLGKHQLNHYHLAMTEYNRGTPVIFWIAKSAQGHRTSVNDSLLDQMETRLIEYAFEQNPGLRNDRKVPRLGFAIDGLPLMGQQHRRARRGEAAGDCARMLGVA